MSDMLDRLIRGALRKAPEIVVNKLLSDVERAPDEPVMLRTEDRLRGRRLAAGAVLPG